jgi:hypothetical protein
MRADGHLSAEARAWRRRIAAGWELDDAAKLILDVGLEAFDRMRQAQALIRRKGLTVNGHAHPATVVERDSRLAMLKALRQLNLDVEPLREKPGRPPGKGYY